MITHTRLKELLRYDPNTGHFTWLVCPSSRARRPCVGDIAGSNRGYGYLQIKIAGKTYASHRLAYFYMTGEWPPEQIDHIDRVKDNNRWSNLRAVTASQNQHNRKDNNPQRKLADIRSYDDNN